MAKGELRGECKENHGAGSSSQRKKGEEVGRAGKRQVRQWEEDRKEDRKGYREKAWRARKAMKIRAACAGGEQEVSVTATDRPGGVLVGQKPQGAEEEGGLKRGALTPTISWRLIDSSVVRGRKPSGEGRHLRGPQRG